MPSIHLHGAYVGGVVVGKLVTLIDETAPTFASSIAERTGGSEGMSQTGQNRWNTYYVYNYSQVIKVLYKRIHVRISNTLHYKPGMKLGAHYHHLPTKYSPYMH